jgi:pyruvate dehydrogenase E2 component (dihydrolipoamide acetyltransferase)
VKEFKFPDVGEGIHEGTVVKWHVKEGDTVKADQTIVDVETDKAVVELPSPASGTILRINFHEGTQVNVGETLVVIGEPGEKVAVSPQPSAAKSAPAAPKPAAAVPVPQARAAPAQSAPPAQSASTSPGEILATPSTRRLARELNVDIATVKGTGPAGRISDDDVKAAQSGGAAQVAGTGQVRGTPQSGGAAQFTGRPAQPGQSAEVMQPEIIRTAEGDIRIPMTGIRKTIADRMSYSKTHIPHACGMDFVDVTKLVMIREREKHIFEPAVHLTYLPFVVKACVIALRKYPSFNAHFDNDKNELIAKKDINVGIAVETPEGLMAPVIKNADRKSVVELAAEIERLATLARERKLRLEDMRGATFTITNVGSVGGFFSTPIIDPPQVAILGMHRIKDMALVVNGYVAARKAMGLSICFDHRVIDGAIATEFLNTVMKHLEDPDLLLVDMS